MFWEFFWDVDSQLAAICAFLQDFTSLSLNRNSHFDFESKLQKRDVDIINFDSKNIFFLLFQCKKTAQAARAPSNSLYPMTTTTSIASLEAFEDQGFPSPGYPLAQAQFDPGLFNPNQNVHGLFHFYRL